MADSCYMSSKFSYYKEASNKFKTKKNETDEQNTKDLDYFDDITTSSEELMSFLTLICVDVSGVRFEKSGSKITYLENRLRHFLDLLSVFLR